MLSPDPGSDAQSIFDAMPWQAAVVDLDGVIRRTNRRWRDLNARHGIPHDDVGTSYFDVCGAAGGVDGSSEAADLLRAVLDGHRESADLEYPCHGPDAPHWFVLSITPVLRGSERIGALLSHHEITRQREAEHDLRAFVSQAAHDLRTPLRHLASFPELLEQDLGPELGEPHRGWLSAIRRAAHRMQSQVDNLLALARSRLEPLEFGPVDLPRLVDDRMSLLGELLASDATLEITPPLPAVVTDAKLLTVLVDNVLTNSMKHGRGQSDLRIRVSGGATQAGYELHLDDNGPGFGDLDPSRLFLPYERGRSSGGLGLGLAIVNQVAQRLGGQLTLATSPEGGARVTVRLPRRDVGTESERPDPKVDSPLHTL